MAPVNYITLTSLKAIKAGNNYDISKGIGISYSDLIGEEIIQEISNTLSWSGDYIDKSGNQSNIIVSDGAPRDQIAIVSDRKSGTNYIQVPEGTTGKIVLYADYQVNGSGNKETLELAITTDFSKTHNDRATLTKSARSAKFSSVKSKIKNKTK